MSCIEEILRKKPLNIEQLSSLIGDESALQQSEHSEIIELVCENFRNGEALKEPLGSAILEQLLIFIAEVSHSREVILHFSDQLTRSENTNCWQHLLKPLSKVIVKIVSIRSFEGGIEDALYGAIQNIFFDRLEESDFYCLQIDKFIDNVIEIREVKRDVGVKSCFVACCLTLAANPLSLVEPENGTENTIWKNIVAKLAKEVSMYCSAYSILVDLADYQHRNDKFLGNYFFNNQHGRWNHLIAGFACLLSCQQPDFQLPLMLEPRYRFFLCAIVTASLLTEITNNPNPDMELPANAFACRIVCQLITDLLVSVPDFSFNAECVSTVPSFTLLIRRLFLNLTGVQDGPQVDVETAGEIVKVIDLFLQKMDFSGRWQLMWMWINQVTADGHPAGPVRAVVIDHFRNLVASSLIHDPDLLNEKVAKMLPMILRLVLAKDSVIQGQAGLVRVDATIACISLLTFLFKLPLKSKLMDDQTLKTVKMWIKCELRPATDSTRNFLAGATRNEQFKEKLTPQTTASPWIQFSEQLLGRLDLVDFSLARMEQIVEE